MSCLSHQPPSWVSPITPIFLANVRFLVKNEGKNVIVFGYFGLIILLRLQETYLKLMAILFLYT